MTHPIPATRKLPSCCCKECFAHPFLVRLIEKTGVNGDCDYCGSTRVATTEVSTLSELFEPLLELYEPTEAGVHYDHRDSDAIDHGIQLGYLINDEWGIFSGHLFATKVGEADPLHELVEDIFSPLFDYKLKPDLGAGSLWSSKERSLFAGSPIEEDWETFSHHIKWRRRYVFGELPFGIADVRGLLSEPLLEELSKQLPKGTRLFRARLGALPPKSARSGVGFDGAARPLGRKEVQPPPREKAKSGRANPEGIPVLYTSTNPETAIAELRPWKGAFVTVATATLQRNATVIDLAGESDFSEAPFGTDTLEWQLRKERVLRMIGSELARPIDPEQSGINYVPTQYVAEVIQEAGYDGIMYKSSLGDQKNVVFFDPSVASVGRTRRVYRVSDVKWVTDRDPYWTVEV